MTAPAEPPQARPGRWLWPVLGLAWCAYFIAFGVRIRDYPMQDRMNRDIEPYFAWFGALLALAASLLALRARSRLVGAIILCTLCIVRVLLRFSSAAEVRPRPTGSDSAHCVLT